MLFVDKKRRKECRELQCDPANPSPDPVAVHPSLQDFDVRPRGDDHGYKPGLCDEQWGCGGVPPLDVRDPVQRRNGNGFAAIVVAMATIPSRWRHLPAAVVTGAEDVAPVDGNCRDQG